MAPIKIEIEGVDCSGKSTAVKTMLAILTEMGLKCIVMAESGFDRIEACVNLRKMVLDPRSTLSPLSMELLFAAQRVENDQWMFHSEEAQECDVIILDRGFLSHLAYGYASDVPRKVIDQLFNGVLCNTRKADHIVYLSVDPEVAKQRMVARGGALDKIEMQGVQHQQKVLHHFETLIKQHHHELGNDRSQQQTVSWTPGWTQPGGSIYTIDANAPLAVVNERIKKWATGLFVHATNATGVE